MTMTTVLPLNEVKSKFSEMVGRVRDHHEEIVITVHGEPAAVLLSAYEFESMQETLAVLNDPGAMAAIRAYEENPDDLVPLAEVQREVAARQTGVSAA